MIVCLLFALRVPITTCRMAWYMLTYIPDIPGYLYLVHILCTSVKAYFPDDTVDDAGDTIEMCRTDPSLDVTPAPLPANPRRSGPRGGGGVQLPPPHIATSFLVRVSVAGG